MAVTNTAFEVAPLERLVHPLPTESANGTAARRSEAFAWIAEHGMPTRHDEPWHYSPHNELGTAMGNAAPAQARSVDPSTIESLAGQHGGPRLVFVNGFYSADLSDPATSSEVWCGPGGQVPSEQHSLVETAEAREFTDGFHALNRADGGEAAVVIAAPGSTTDAPIHIVHLTAPGDTLEVAHPRTVIVIGQNASAAIIESFVGLDGAALRNTDTTISLGADATLTHHRVQTEAGEAIHIGHTDVIQAANSTLMSTSVMFGARIARNAFRVEFTGEHATANLSGIQVLNEGQRHDTMITADHRASSCYSDQEFKSVIEERSRSSFSGHIIVRPGVVDTDAHQTNRNLLLYRDPSVDGLKTGHTTSAGYNLVASSNRNGRRVISVVMGTESMQARATESSKLLNWALQAFDTPKLYEAEAAISQVKVYKGENNVVNVGFTEAAYITVPHGEGKRLTPILETEQPVLAPITKGQVLGVIKFVDANQQVVAQKEVVALNDVAQAGFFGRMWDSIVLWFKDLFGGGE